MGGYSDGAVASKVVSDAILNFILVNFNQYKPIELLRESIIFANDALMLKRIASSSKRMGCVITTLLISGKNAYLTWLGDSRIYMYRDGQEVYRTEDHSVIKELAKANMLRSTDVKRLSSIVTKSIMGKDMVDVAPIRKIKIDGGDVFVLCTDGFYKEIDMRRAFYYEDSCKEELDAISNNISDNYSFIKVEV